MHGGLEIQTTSVSERSWEVRFAARASQHWRRAVCTLAHSVHIHVCIRSGHGALENGEGNFSGNDVWCRELICMGSMNVKLIASFARQGPCLDYLKDRISLQDAVGETHSMPHRLPIVLHASETNESRSGGFDIQSFTLPSILCRGSGYQPDLSRSRARSFADVLLRA